MNPYYLLGKEAPITRLPQPFPRTIDENLMLGLDIGIGSCGQALVSLDRSHDQPLGELPCFFDSKTPSFIRYMGVRTFDVPEENSKTGVKLKNPDRRASRLLRRVVRRRAARMFRARNLLKREGVLPADYHIDQPGWRQRHEQSTPWVWRLEGLTRKLDAWEWAASLLHFAKHRGFKSNKKSDLDSKGKDGGTLQCSRANHEVLRSHYQSVAEMMARDSRFTERKRNRAEDYLAMILRDDLKDEIQLLFKCQRGFGNPYTSEKLEAEFLEIFYSQKPLQNPYALLGDCPFERDQKRGSRYAFSFELSRALQRLNTLTLLLPDQRKVFLKDHVCASHEGYDAFIAGFGKQKKISWNDLREIFALDDAVRFLDLPMPRKGGKKKGPLTVVTPAEANALRKEAEKSDFAVRSAKETCAQGAYALRKILGEPLWTELLQRPDDASLDNVAFCLTFFESIDAIVDVLNGRNLQEHLRDDKGKSPKSLPSYAADARVISIIEADLKSATPSLLNFKGTVSLSAKASRKLIPHLAKGLVYSEACNQAGYQHTDSDYALKNIVNPVVASVLREVMKQVVHVVNQAGVIPGAICVELGRDLGKSIDERNEMASGINKRTDERNENRAELAKELGVNIEAVDDEMLLRYELWAEQSSLCPYCGEPLPPARQCVSGNAAQLDHILPRSRSHDNSFNNKVLVHTGCNQDKKSRTPAEWLGAAQNSEKWQLFVATVRQMPHMKLFKKKRYLLNETFSTPEETEKFLSRNLNDTRYISKVILEYLKDLYRLAGEDPNAKGAKRRVFAQPGALTSLVRRAWGLEHLKKDVEGQRIDDKHHAVDALVCACLSEGQRQRITRDEQHRRAGAVFGATFENLSRAYEVMEGRHESRLTPVRVAAPWVDFRRDVVHALDQLNVSRRESRKGKGQLHLETFYRMEPDENGAPCYYSRKSLIQKEGSKLVPLFRKIEDMEDVKGIHEPKNSWLKKALGDWIANGSPMDGNSLPRNPAGAIIRKLTLNVGSKSGRPSPHGYIVGGNMVCVDVFSKTKKKKGGTAEAAPAEKTYYLVPVYSYQLKEENPPMRAIAANKPEDQWDLIDETYAFEFSLWPNSLFEVQKKPSKEKPKGEYLRGYYRGVNRANGKMEARSLNDAKEDLFCSVKQGCIFFHKLNIDRLGRIFRVKGEKRVWHGKVCI